MPLDARELIFALHKHDGIQPIGKLPGLWRRKLDERWEIWINGHANVLLTEAGVEVAPADCYVEYNGWPAGAWNLVRGDGVIAAGAAANYETFCDALRKAATVELPS